MDDEIQCTSCRQLKQEEEMRTRAGNDVCVSCVERIKRFRQQRADQKPAAPGK